MLDIIRANAQSWGVKIAFGIIILVFVFWGVGSFTGGPSTVALTVNGEPVTIQQFQRQYEFLENQLRAQMPGLDAETLKAMRLGQSVVQQLVVQALLSQEAARVGIIITPQELRRAIEQIPAFHNDRGRFDPDIYVRVLTARQDAPGRFEARLRQELLMEKMQREVTAGAFVSEAEVKDLYLYDGERRILEYVLFPLTDYASKVSVSDADIRASYDSSQHLFRIPAQADVEYLLIGAGTLAASEKIEDTAITAEYEKNADRYSTPERMRARHILLSLEADASEETVNRVRSEIEALEKRIRNSKEDFAELARRHSQDPGSAVQGGDLGWFLRHQMVQPFAEAAFALKPGEMSAPVRTQFGYHLIRAEEYEPGSKRPLDEVREEIGKRLAEEQAAGKVQDVLEQIQLDVIGGKDLAASGEPFGLVTTRTGLKDHVELARILGIRPENLTTLLNAAPGTTPDTPLVTREGYLLATLKELKPETVKPLADVTGEIRERLERERTLALATEEARTIRSDMGNEAPSGKRRILKSEPMGREGLLPGLNDASGPDAALGRAVFEAKPGQWLPEVYPLDAGAAIVRVAEVVRPSDESWAAASEQISLAVLEAKRRQMFQSFLAALHSEAKIEIRDERILQ